MNIQQTHNALTNQKICCQKLVVSNSAARPAEASGNYQFLTTFFGQKVTTEQFRFCNDR